jgi:hypothetical protein
MPDDLAGILTNGANIATIPILTIPSIVPELPAGTIYNPGKNGFILIGDGELTTGITASSRTTPTTLLLTDGVAAESGLGKAATSAADDVAGGAAKVVGDSPTPLGPPSLVTNADEAVFWSGLKGKYVTAAEWAVENGGSTLESTMAARGINLPKWDPTNPEIVAQWQSASKAFADGASGSVRVLQENTVGVDSVFGSIEFPALKANPNVTEIIAIDPKTGAQTILWKR